MNTEEKELVKDIIDSYKGEKYLSFIVEHNNCDDDIVLVVCYEKVYLDWDSNHTKEYEEYHTIKKNEHNKEYAIELYKFIKENTLDLEVESILLFSDTKELNKGYYL